MQSKDRTYQVIAIVALVIGVCALTVGFAAFTTNLTISSSAEVSPSSSVLDVVFSTSNSSVVPGTVAGNVVTGNATANTATLDNTTVTGIKANFTEPGQKVTYTFNVYNNSAFKAYLTGLTFMDVTGESTQRTCVPTSGSANPAANGYADACADITLKISIGSLVTGADDTKTTAQINDSTGLNAGSADTVVVEVEYPAGSHTADGDFTVTFGDIKLTYSSVSGV